MPIPDDATEIINDTHETGQKMRVSYLVDGLEIGWRYFNEDGILLMEYEMRDGRKNGRHRSWHDNGVICEEGFYEDDKEHGETKQYDEKGRQIGSYVMVHGTGLDLWYESPGVLSEEREYRNGQRYGYERWWSGDNHTIHAESHFWKDQQHGIVRQWNRKGRLSRGYPKYFISGEQMTKRQYMRACQTDTTLPPFVAADNRPERPLPHW